MTLKDYFETAKGVGVLATADREGFVNGEYEKKSKFLVTFRIDRTLPLIGEGD